MRTVRLEAPASFSAFFGGGADTPISKHLAIRFEGGYQYTNFALYQSLSYKLPYRIPGLPSNFGRFSTGFVWTPHLKSASGGATAATAMNVGRLKASWYTKRSAPSVTSTSSPNPGGAISTLQVWSMTGTPGESSSEREWTIPPISCRVAILTQPTKTDEWGNPLTTDHEHVAGLAISPIGLRMMWRDGERIKPYFLMKGGIIGFTKKALTENASYEDFTVQWSLGAQFKLTDRWDFRAGFLFLHFSNACIVPINPGLDSLTYNAGLSYHLGKQKAGR